MKGISVIDRSASMSRGTENPCVLSLRQKHTSVARSSHGLIFKMNPAFTAGARDDGTAVAPDQTEVPHLEALVLDDLSDDLVEVPEEFVVLGRAPGSLGLDVRPAELPCAHLGCSSTMRSPDSVDRNVVRTQTSRLSDGAAPREEWDARGEGRSRSRWNGGRDTIDGGTVCVNGNPDSSLSALGKDPERSAL
jgi:hypothetical protein